MYVFAERGHNIALGQRCFVLQILVKSLNIIGSRVTQYKLIVNFFSDYGRARKNRAKQSGSEPRPSKKRTGVKRY
jgi:hypothetical protein